uniref:Uncharacterized protein n=1 Tax=Anguilla anguilla TaxID=7936 RepID=A0A0E9TGC2_ANGAN
MHVTQTRNMRKMRFAVGCVLQVPE